MKDKMKENIKKFVLIFGLFILNLTLPINTIASSCNHVYTIGAYDEAFAKHATVAKLGPMAAVDVPPIIPKSFLEKDGSYGGGEALCTIKAACTLLNKQLASGQLPQNQSWHIYLLYAEWKRDTYKLHANDFRIKHTVKVLKLVKEDC